MNATDTIRQVILAEMLTLYQPPRQVQNEKQASVYHTAVIDCLAQFNPTEDELRRMWAKWKREYKGRTWPTPGDLCQALSAERGKPPPAQARAIQERDDTMTPEDERKFRECVADLRANPQNYFRSEALLKMAEEFERRDR